MIVLLVNSTIILLPSLSTEMGSISSNKFVETSYDKVHTPSMSLVSLLANSVTEYLLLLFDLRETY